MTKIPKTFFAISLMAFSIGLVVTFGNFELPSGWGVALPLGAVSFEMFLITFILQNESAKFGEEERVRFQYALTATPGDSPAPTTYSSTAAAGNGSLIAAPSH